MDLRKEFRNLVTNQYMPGYDYKCKNYSFRTVHYVSHLQNIYCMCACAYELEFLDFISDKGDIDEEMYERVVQNLIKGKCPHVDSARNEFVNKTCTCAKHIAMAVGTLSALNKIGLHLRIGGVYKRNAMEIGLVKNSVRSIDEILRQLVGDEPGILDIECLEGVRQDSNANVLEIKQRNAVLFCVEKEYTNMLKRIINDPEIGHKPYNIASALSIAMKRNLHDIQFYLIQYIKDIACQPYYAKNRCYEAYGGLYQKYYGDCAILFGDTVLLRKLLENSYMDLTQMVKLEQIALLLNRTECSSIISSSLPTFLLPQSLTQVELLHEMIDLFVRFNDGFENEIKAGISTILHSKICSDYKNTELRNTRNPPLLHLYLLNPTGYGWDRHFFPRGSCSHHISVFTELDGTINCVYLNYGTALNYTLSSRSLDTSFREILETLIFENSDIELNPTAVLRGLRIDLENQKQKRTDFSVTEGIYIMDSNFHGLFEGETGDDEALNFTAPLLIECGYTLSRNTFQENMGMSMLDFFKSEPDNVSNILPDVKVYINQYLETPRRLTHCCRDVLRKHFKGRQIHRFVVAADMPKPIQDFVLLKPVLRCIFPVKKE